MIEYIHINMSAQSDIHSYSYSNSIKRCNKFSWLRSRKRMID